MKILDHFIQKIMVDTVITTMIEREWLLVIIFIKYLSSNTNTIFIGTETIIFPDYDDYCYSGSEFIVADDSSEV